jgi:hypothetical protein
MSRIFKCNLINFLKYSVSLTNKKKNFFLLSINWFIYSYKSISSISSYWIEKIRAINRVNRSKSIIGRFILRITFFKNWRRFITKIIFGILIRIFFNFDRCLFLFLSMKLRFVCLSWKYYKPESPIKIFFEKLEILRIIFVVLQLKKLFKSHLFPNFQVIDRIGNHFPIA